MVVASVNDFDVDVSASGGFVAEERKKKLFICVIIQQYVETKLALSTETF